jgi:DNA-binding MarR family transcriptional regulator
MTQTLPRELNRHIVILNRKRRRYMDEHLRNLGLVGPMYSFLLCLEKNPGISQDYLANYFSIDKGTVARLARQLAERDYIRREINAADRRIYQLTMTDKGRDALLVINDCLNRWSGLMLKGFSEEDSQTALKLLQRMSDNIDS